MPEFSVDNYFAEKARMEKLEKQKEKAAKYCAEQHKLPFFGYENNDTSLLYRVNCGEWKEFDGQVAELAKNTDNKIDVQIGKSEHDSIFIGDVYNIAESEGMIFVIGEEHCWSNEDFLDSYIHAVEELGELDTINIGAFPTNEELDGLDEIDIDFDSSMLDAEISADDIEIEEEYALEH